MTRGPVRACPARFCENKLVKYRIYGLCCRVGAEFFLYVGVSRKDVDADIEAARSRIKANPLIAAAREAFPNEEVFFLTTTLDPCCKGVRCASAAEIWWIKEAKDRYKNVLNKKEGGTLKYGTWRFDVGGEKLLSFKELSEHRANIHNWDSQELQKMIEVNLLTPLEAFAMTKVTQKTLKKCETVRGAACVRRNRPKYIPTDNRLEGGRGWLDKIMTRATDPTRAGNR